MVFPHLPHIMVILQVVVVEVLTLVLQQLKVVWVVEEEVHM